MEIKSNISSFDENVSKLASLWIGYILDDNHASKVCLFKNRKSHLKNRLHSKKQKKKKNAISGWCLGRKIE